MTDKPDTSPEAVETLCSLLKHNRAWDGLQDVDREAYDQAEATLRALAAERDAAVARAEAAEAKLEKAVAFIEDLQGCEWPYGAQASRILAALEGQDD